MKREFCARINEAWGGNLIREVKFTAGKPGPRRVSREMDNEHTPFIRRRKPDTSRPVPPEMLAELAVADAIVSGIGD